MKSWFWLPVPVVASAAEAPPSVSSVDAARIIMSLESMSFLILAPLGEAFSFGERPLE